MGTVRTRLNSGLRKVVDDKIEGIGRAVEVDFLASLEMFGRDSCKTMLLSEKKRPGSRQKRSLTPELIVWLEWSSSFLVNKIEKIQRCANDFVALVQRHIIHYISYSTYANPRLFQRTGRIK